MKAAVTVEWNKMEVQETPIPEPGPGEALVRVKLAGICGSDVHIFQGHHPTAVSPVAQGHEFVGTLEKVNGANINAAIGDRVVVEPLISCGVCEACREGHMHVCRNLGLLGIHRHGAFAEYVVVDAAKVIRVPDTLSNELAALTEPVAVAAHVTARGGLQKGDRTLVIGAGPIGLIVAMMCEWAGATVALVEINPERIEQAKSLGFTVVNANGDAAADALALTDGEGFDQVYEASGAAPAAALATEVCRIRGTIVGIGFPSPPPAFDVRALIFKELHLVGSRVYTLDDFHRTVRMMANLNADQRERLAALITETCDIHGVADGIGKMMRGECKGKILVNLSQE